MEAYRKLWVLKKDFEKLKTLTSLVVYREKLTRAQLLLIREHFAQRLYDCVDTSGLPRQVTPVEYRSAAALSKRNGDPRAP